MSFSRRCFELILSNRRNVKRTNCSHACLYVTNVIHDYRVIEEEEFHQLLTTHFDQISSEDLQMGDIICICYNTHMNPRSYQHAFVYFKDDVVFQRAGPYDYQKYEFVHIFDVVLSYCPKVASYLMTHDNQVTIQSFLNFHKKGYLVFRRKRISQ